MAVKIKTIKPGEEFRMGDDLFAYSVINGEIALKYVRESKSKAKVFIAPSLEEVKKYFDLKGYSGADDYFRFYSENTVAWTNSKGKPISDWQATARQNWFSEKNKIRIVKSKISNVGENLIEIGKKLGK